MIRQVATVLLLPFYIVAGVMVSVPLASFLGVWDFYLYAVTIPAIGLVSTWVLAPFSKTYNLIYVYCLGVFVAFWLSCPAYYPEWHPNAYMPTYAPFMIVVAWGAVIMVSLLILESRISPHNKKQQADLRRLC